MNTNDLFNDGTMSVRLALVDRSRNADKFYETSIMFDPLNATFPWSVKTSWGRQGQAPQSKTYPLFRSEDAAKNKARAIVRNKLKKGYSIQSQPEKEAVQALTRLRKTARDAKRVKRNLGKPQYTDELLYELSAVTKAMHKLSSDRYTAMSSAEGFVDDAMKRRFETTDEGRLVKEVWGRMYEPTAKRNEHVAPTPAASVREVVHEQLDELPEWTKIQERCQRDAVLSSVTARHLAEHVVHAIIANYPEPDEKPPAEPQGDPGDQQDPGGMDVPPNGEAATGAESGPAGYDISPEAKAQIRSQLSGALQEAHDKIDAADKAMDFAWGRGPSDLSDAVDPEEALSLAQLLAKDNDLREMLEAVGRYMRTFQDIEATEYGTGGTTPFSVTPDDDLRRLLPSERIGLSHPLLQLQTMHRYMQRQTLCYEVRSREPKSQGPFVVCLDTSASMRGRINEAKAFAIAAMQVAANEGRDVHFVRFASDAIGIDIDLSAPGPRVKALMTIAKVTASGGTDFDAAWGEARTWLDRREDADILHISDGECSFDAAWTENFEHAGTQLHYIHIGHGDGDEKLNELATQTLTVDDFSRLDDMAKLAISAAHREP